MLAALIALPANTTLDYTGMPQLTAPAAYDIRGHSATIRIEGETVTVESTTEYRYRGDATTGTITIPLFRADAENPDPLPPAYSKVEATWDKKSLVLSPAAGSFEPSLRSAPQASQVPLGKQSTHALRLRMTLPLGRTGRAPQRRIAGYLLEGKVPIGVLNIAYQYGPPTVFGLPAVAPNFGWKVGDRGAFVRKANFTPTGEMTTLAFWPGGF